MDCEENLSSSSNLYLWIVEWKHYRFVFSASGKRVPSRQDNRASKIYFREYLNEMPNLGDSHSSAVTEGRFANSSQLVTARLAGRKRRCTAGGTAPTTPDVQIERCRNLHQIKHVENLSQIHPTNTHIFWDGSITVFFLSASGRSVPPRQEKRASKIRVRKHRHEASKLGDAHGTANTEDGRSCKLIASRNCMARCTKTTLHTASGTTLITPHVLIEYLVIYPRREK